jgi:hypothetical protein
MAGQMKEAGSMMGGTVGQIEKKAQRGKVA